MQKIEKGDFWPPFDTVGYSIQKAAGYSNFCWNLHALNSILEKYFSIYFAVFFEAYNKIWT